MNAEPCLIFDNELCSPEICPFLNGPSLCFEPGERLPDVEFEDKEPEPTNKPIQKEEEKGMEKEPKQKRKYRRRAKPGDPERIPGETVGTLPDGPVIETLVGKLYEHNEAAWAIMGALATLRELGIKFDLPVMEWPR